MVVCVCACVSEREREREREKELFPFSSLQVFPFSFLQQKTQFYTKFFILPKNKVLVFPSKKEVVQHEEADKPRRFKHAATFMTKYSNRHP